jgi:hypothetical protein
VSVVENTVVVSRGCGVTTAGDLISLEEDRTYTQVLPYVINDHAPYAPFQGIVGLQLWELFPAEYEDDRTKENISAAFLADKVVMLYLESQITAADNCTGVSCDNQGDRFQNRLYVLLVRQTDAVHLIEASHRQAAAACSKLPRIFVRRVQIDALPYDISLKSFQSFIQSLVEKFSKALETSYNQISAVMNPEYGGISPVAEWQKILQIKFKEYSKNATIQYIYDWLKDLFDAYEEFRLATCCWLSACLPAETWFPKHLLLGELTLSSCQAQYRHYFLRTPAVLDCKYSRDHAIWLHRRIGHLIEGFQIPVLRRSADIQEFRGELAANNFSNLSLRARLDKIPLNNMFLRVTPPKITPSHTRTSALGDRAMPFYYKPSVREHWSYEKGSRCQSSDILSFHPPQNPPDYVEEPFNYAIDQFSFYRIEGILNEEIDDIVKVIRTLRNEYNLAFDIVALRTDAQQSLFKGDVTFETRGFEREYQDIIDDIRTLYRSLAPASQHPAPVIRAARDLSRMATPATRVITRVDLGGIKSSRPLLDAISRFELDLSNFTLNPGTLLPSFPLDNIQLSYAEFTRRRNAALSSLHKREPAKVVDALIGKLNTLDKIKQAYDAYIREFEEKLTFGNYFQKHPGLEHAAGVTRGGTFVLVYKDFFEKNSRSPVQRVVADFYLPYLGNIS